MKNKNKFLLVFVIIFVSFFFTETVFAQEPDITAPSAVLLDADSGAVLFAKDPYTQRPIASTTKILTAILAIEKGNMDEVVEISKRAANTGEANINLQAGEKITLLNLLYGALLKSGNDACVAIAEHISPTVEEYVRLMNLKAMLLGCNATNFVNTNGLPAKNHYSTAYDLALMARYAMKNQIFANIVATPSYTVSWNESSRKRLIKNTNRLLQSYPGANGIKTGTTYEAGQCLVASASKNDRNLIAVVLKSRNRFSDAQKLLNYGFKGFKNIKLSDNNNNYYFYLNNKEVPLKIGKTFITTMPIDEEVNISKLIKMKENFAEKKIAKDEVVGYIYFINKEKEIGKVPLIAMTEIDITGTKNVLNKIKNFFDSVIY